jgi:hypothetical protein
MIKPSLKSIFKVVQLLKNGFKSGRDAANGQGGRDTDAQGGHRTTLN